MMFSAQRHLTQRARTRLEILFTRPDGPGGFRRLFHNYPSRALPYSSIAYSLVMDMLTQRRMEKLSLGLGSKMNFLSGLFKCFYSSSTFTDISAKNQICFDYASLIGKASQTLFVKLVRPSGSCGRLRFLRETLVGGFVMLRRFVRLSPWGLLKRGIAKFFPNNLMSPMGSSSTTRVRQPRLRTRLFGTLSRIRERFVIRRKHSSHLWALTLRWSCFATFAHWWSLTLFFPRLSLVRTLTVKQPALRYGSRTIRGLQLELWGTPGLQPADWRLTLLLWMKPRMLKRTFSPGSFFLNLPPLTARWYFSRLPSEKIMFSIDVSQTETI